MEDNTYNRITKIEKDKIQARNLLLILQGMKDLNEKFDEISKGIRTVREELRNVGKLRPLRSKAEEAKESEQATVTENAGTEVKQ